MKCSEIRQQYLARDWDRSALDEALRIDEHLRQCPGCREAEAEYEELRKVLRVPGPMPDFPGVGWKNPPLLAPPGPSPERNLRWRWPAAVAASLAAGILGWAMYLGGLHGAGEVARPQPASEDASIATTQDDGRKAQELRPVPPDANDGTPPFSPPPIQWTRADVDRQVQVFAHVSETFQGRTSWVATGDNAAELGLMPTAGHQRKVLLLRLVMSQGEQARSKTDLVILPGQDASLDVPFEAGQVLRYHIATTAALDRRLSLWAEVRTPNGSGETLAALATQFNPVPGQSLNAGRLVTVSGGYNLEISFQEHELPKAKS
jgi:hypothetical protein